MKEMTMKPAIIFDLDGTLIDTPSGIVETFIAVLKSMDIAFNDAGAIKATVGLPLEKAFSNLLGVNINDAKMTYAVSQYQTLFKEIVLPNAKELIFPGILKGLAHLKAQNFILAVATSKVYRSAEALLKAADLWKYFDLVIGADQVTHPKPHPEMGLLVMKQLDVLAENTLMVGDTTHDILMARDSGMRSIAVTYGVHDIQKLKSAEPTWIEYSFDEVLNRVLTEVFPPIKG
jgi:phosphoglycolate phosphatase